MFLCLYDDVGTDVFLLVIVQEMKQLMDNSANLSAAELEQKKDELLQKQKVNMSPEDREPTRWQHISSAHKSLQMHHRDIWLCKGHMRIVSHALLNNCGQG